MGAALLKTGHQLKLLQGSQALFEAMVQAIDASEHEVRLETYIFNVQRGGEHIVQALERAAMRGVAVFLVVDGVGTPTLPPPWPQRLSAAGVQWRVFKPLGHLGWLAPSHWRRLHRKLCVVDGQVAFCGGINLIDDWVDPHGEVMLAPRFDFAVQVSGPLVQDLHAMMAQFWWRLQAAQSVKQVDWLGAWQALQKALKKKGSPSRAAEPLTAAALAELVLRDNLRFRTRIERTYRQAFADARHDIVLANAYFLPGRKIRKSLIHAARRGVRVRLLLQGRYENFMQYHATHALYGSLLAAGIEIYEYTPSFLHAKVAVVDGLWATVGSSNMDPLSLLLAREANVVVKDEPFAKGLQHCLALALKNGARQVDFLQHRSRTWRVKMLDHAAYLLMRVILFLNGKRY
jgi:cardiolipin synthase